MPAAQDEASFLGTVRCGRHWGEPRGKQRWVSGSLQAARPPGDRFMTGQETGVGPTDDFRGDRFVVSRLPSSRFKGSDDCEEPGLMRNQLGRRDSREGWWRKRREGLC